MVRSCARGGLDGILGKQKLEIRKKHWNMSPMGGHGVTIPGGAPEACGHGTLRCGLTRRVVLGQQLDLTILESLVGKHLYNYNFFNQDLKKNKDLFLLSVLLPLKLKEADGIMALDL